MLQQQRRLEDSLAHFRAALRLDPKFADAAHNLALALLKANRPTEALETLEQHPFNTADHHALKGAVFNALARPVEAVVLLRRASALAPGNQDYVYDLAIVLLKLEQFGEAAAVLKKARRLFPGSSKIHAASGMLAFLQGNNAEAAREYETATKIEPGAADLWAALGDVHAATGSLPQADSAYAKAVNLDTASAEYRVKAGRNLLKFNRSAEAEAVFRGAVRLDPKNAEAHLELGKLAAARGDHPSAIMHYEHAVASQPSLNSAWYQLSLSYRRNGEEAKSREALEYFRKTQ